MGLLSRAILLSTSGQLIGFSICYFIPGNAERFVKLVEKAKNLSKQTLTWTD